MPEEKYSSDFLFLHIFACKEIRLTYQKLAEKRDPPEARTTIEDKCDY